MRLIKGIILILVVVVFVLLIQGYRITSSDAGMFRITSPSIISPYNDEATANSPACLDEDYPTKSVYTTQELDIQTNAAMKCLNQKIEYIKNK